MTDSGRRTAWLLRSIGLAAAYALLATLVSGFFSANGVFTVIWPPSGLALAALLIGGKRYLPGIYAGALAASLLAGSPLWVAIVIAAGNTAEALIGYTLLQRAGCADPSLRGVAGYFQLLFRAAGLATLIGATIPNEAARHFESELERGRILIAVEWPDLKPASLEHLPGLPPGAVRRLSVPDDGEA